MKPGATIHGCAYGPLASFVQDRTRERWELVSFQPVSLTNAAIFRLQTDS